MISSVGWEIYCPLISLGLTTVDSLCPPYGGSDELF